MVDTLEIHVNRSHPNDIEVPETFETSGDFVIEVRNGGKPVHVHVNYDDDLSDGLTMDVGNHFIPRTGVRRLPVEVDGAARPFHGKFRVSVGYGSETRFVEIRVIEPDGGRSVTVDERLAEPRQRPVATDRSEWHFDELGALALVGIAFLGLLAGALIVGGLTNAVLGALVLVVGMLLAVGVYLLIAG